MYGGLRPCTATVTGWPREPGIRHEEHTMKRLGIRTRLAIVVALVTALTTTVLGLGTFQTVVYEVTDFGRY